MTTASGRVTASPSPVRPSLVEPRSRASATLARVRGAMVEEVLPATACSVTRARALVSDLCRRWSVDADAAETAVLLTSETVTNAVIHGRSEVRLCAEVTQGWVQVGVGDDNSRHPRLQTQDAQALDGRGLQILELAASRWGVEEQEVGKVVWFQVDRSTDRPGAVGLEAAGS